MIVHTVRGGRYAALPPVADDWHHHEFSPHVDRPKSCIVCGRTRVWRHHIGPFLNGARPSPRTNLTKEDTDAA